MQSQTNKSMNKLDQTPKGVVIFTKTQTTTLVIPSVMQLLKVYQALTGALAVIKAFSCSIRKLDTPHLTKNKITHSSSHSY